MPTKDINSNESLKEIIKTAMDENGGKIELDYAKDLIRPHFNYDNEKLVENALTTKTRYIIYSLKDKKGVRVCVANNTGLYFNITLPDNIDELLQAEKQVRLKYVGIKKLLNKIRRQIKELDGQISLPEIEELEMES